MNAEIELDSRLELYVRAARETQPASEVSGPVLGRLAQAIDNHELEASTAGATGWLSRLMPRVALNWAGGSAAAAVVLAVILVLATGTTQPAFAAVVAQLDQVRTMVYRGHMISAGKAMMDVTVYYRAPANVRVENTSLAGGKPGMTLVNVLDVSKGKGIVLMPQPKIAVPFSFSPKGGPADQVDPLDWFEKVKQYQGEVTHLPAREIDGEKVTGFEIHPEGMTVTLWVDGHTDLPVQVHVTNADATFELDANLVFNQVLDDQLFSLAPAPGYTLRSPDGD